MKLDPTTGRQTIIDGTSYLTFDDADGDSYIKLCDNLPSLNDPQSKAQRAEYLALKPTWNDDPTGVTRGWFVPSDELATKPVSTSAQPLAPKPLSQQ